MKMYFVLLVASLCLNAPAAFAATEGGGPVQDAQARHEKREEKRAHITPGIARRVGIGTAVAGPGTLFKTVTAYGRVSPVPDNVSHIRARFPGVITEVRVSVGDTVKAGDVLARIESNQSLKVYPLRSPIAGVITGRHANTGEFANDSIVFTVSNFDVLWADLKIFPSQRARVSPGDTVVLSTESLSQTTTLLHLVPGSDGSPFVIARAKLRNGNGHWAPGLFLKGRIQTDTIDAALVVPERALQTLDGQAVAFVVKDEAFVARPVTTGRSDGERIEILAGLEAGESYVVNNSYLIKADIEKAGAAHSH